MHDVRKPRRTSVRRLDTGSISEAFLPYGSDYYPCGSAINLVGFAINLDEVLSVKLLEIQEIRIKQLVYDSGVVDCRQPRAPIERAPMEPMMNNTK